MKKSKLLKTLGCITLVGIPAVIAPIALVTSCDSNDQESITITDVNKNYTTEIGGPNIIINPKATINTSKDDKSIKWSLKSSVEGATISNTTGQVTFEPTTAGDFDLTIVACSDDNDKLFAEATTIISVTQGSITISGVEKTYTADTGVEIAIRPQAKIITSSENKNITWSLKTAVSGASISTDSGEVKFTPSTEGQYDLTIVATSAANSMIKSEVSTTINAVAGNISITDVDATYTTKINGPDVTINPQAKITTSYTDKNVTWKLKNQVEGATISAINGQVNFKPTNTGDFILTIVATSVANSNLIAEATTTITVNPDSIVVSSIQGIELVQDGVILYKDGTALEGINYSTSLVENNKAMPNVDLPPIEIYFYVNNDSTRVNYSDIAAQISLEVTATNACEGNGPVITDFFIVENDKLITTNQKILDNYNNQGNSFVYFDRATAETGWFKFLGSWAGTITITYGISSSSVRESIDITFTNNPTILQIS